MVSPYLISFYVSPKDDQYKQVPAIGTDIMLSVKSVTTGNPLAAGHNHFFESNQRLYTLSQGLRHFSVYLLKILV